MLRLGAAFAMVIVAAQPAHAQGAASAQREAMLARAKAAELPGRHEPPPGDILSHQAGAYANLLCNQIFVSGFEAAAGPTWRTRRPGSAGRWPRASGRSG